jgi:molybdate transport system ATP-binding protein
MLATVRPEGISALNLLEATVAGIGRSDGAMVEVALAIGDDRLTARITLRSLAALRLAPGSRCFTLLKSVAVGHGDLGLFEDSDA